MSGYAHMNHATNLTMSISLVRKELEATLQKAEGYFAQYAEEQDQAHLKLFTDELNLVRGTFKLLELKGPELLVTEMLSLMGHTSVNLNARIEALGQGLISLSNYMNLVMEKEQDHPVLLISGINQVRRAGGHKPLTESHFFTANLRPKLPSLEKSKLNLKPHLPRLRLMYQAGLLRTLKDKESQVGLKLIQRSLVLLERGFRGYTAWSFWWCCKAALDAMVQEEYELTQDRKVMFVRIDFMMKAMIKQGLQVLTGDQANELLKDLLHIVALAENKDNDIGKVKHTFKLSVFASEQQLKAERKQLRGPSIGAYDSLAAAFKDEVNSVKQALDHLGKGGLSAEGLSDLKVRIKALAGVLRVINQDSLASVVEKQLAATETVNSLDDKQKLDVLAHMAEAFLQIELACEQFSAGEVKQDDKIIGAGHFVEAKIVLFDEIVSGLAMAKRAIASYVEDQDKLHLANVSKVLSGVWGALIFLQQEQGAKIILFAMKYIEQKVLNAETGAFNESRLEVLADALTSIEYYVETISHSENGGNDILALATKSVSQLGFKIK